MGLIPNATSELLERVLQFRNHRHDVIAGNLANSSTPGYRAFDLVLDAARGAAAPLLLRRPDPRHLYDGGGGGAAAGTSASVSRAQPRLDGNNVSVEEELVKLLENRTVYQAAFELRDKLGALASLAREIR